MKNIKLFFIYIFSFLCISLYSTQAQVLKGTELCNNFYSYLEELNCNTEKQFLFNSDPTFPYNIILSFDNNINTQDNEKRTTLNIIFDLEQAFYEKELIKNIIQNINKTKLDYAIELIFTYGDEQNNLLKTYKPKGIDIFIDSIYDTEEISTICINFNYTENKSIIIPGGGKTTSPSWLVKHTINSFNEQIPFELLGQNLTPLYRLNILQEDKKTSRLLRENIPSIGINLNLQNIQKENLVTFFNNLTTNYSIENTNYWDKHYFSILIGKNFYCINENITILIYLLCSFITLFIFCEFSISTKQKNSIIKKDSLKSWYLIPLTIFITIIGLFIGQLIAFLLYKILNLNSYFQFLCKLTLGIILSSILYVFITKNKKRINQNEYKILTNISGIINIAIFSLIDISFFYIFILEYAIIYASNHIKRTKWLCLIIFAMLIPFIPFFSQITKFLRADAFSKFAFSSFIINFIISLAFLPFELLWFRILTKLNFKWKKTSLSKRKIIKQNVITISIAVFIFICILTIIIIFVPEKYKTYTLTKELYSIKDINDEKIKVSISSKKSFDDVIQTVYVDLENQAEEVLIKIENTDNNSIIFSDNNFFNSQRQQSSLLSLPIWPPKKFNFNYITSSKEKPKITIEAVYPTDEKDLYLKRTKIIEK